MNKTIKILLFTFFTFFIAFTVVKAINTLETGYMLPPNTTLNIDVHGESRYITNNSESNTYFIPTLTAEEWITFITHPTLYTMISEDAPATSCWEDFDQYCCEAWGNSFGQYNFEMGDPDGNGTYGVSCGGDWIDATFEDRTLGDVQCCIRPQYEGWLSFVFAGLNEGTSSFLKPTGDWICEADGIAYNSQDGDFEWDWEGCPCTSINSNMYCGGNTNEWGGHSESPTHPVFNTEPQCDRNLNCNDGSTVCGRGQSDCPNSELLGCTDPGACNVNWHTNNGYYAWFNWGRLADWSNNDSAACWPYTTDCPWGPNIDDGSCVYWEPCPNCVGQSGYTVYSCIDPEIQFPEPYGPYYECQDENSNGFCDAYAGDDCLGVPDGNTLNDDCYVCGGNNSSCSDCNEVSWGPLYGHGIPKPDDDHWGTSGECICQVDAWNTCEDFNPDEWDYNNCAAWHFGGSGSCFSGGWFLDPPVYFDECDSLYSQESCNTSPNCYWAVGWMTPFGPTWNDNTYPYRWMWKGNDSCGVCGGDGSTC